MTDDSKPRGFDTLSETMAAIIEAEQKRRNQRMGSPSEKPNLQRLGYKWPQIHPPNIKGLRALCKTLQGLPPVRYSAMAP
jgi:hypothetical protein